MRRANYYMRHLLINADGKFSLTLEWIAKARDPGLVCHPILALLSDTVWGRLAQRTFLFRKSWFLFTLLIFIGGQSILKHLHSGENGELERTLVFSFRTFIYTFSMTQLLWTHLSKTFRQMRKKDFVILYGWIPVPAYLKSWQEAAGFCLMVMLVMVLVLEPILWCLNDGEGNQFFEKCAAADQVQMPYSIFSML